MKARKRILMILSLFFLCSCVSATINPGQGTYKEIDSRVFASTGYVDKSKSEVVSPDRGWTWYNSWHIVKRQPGFMGKGISNGPYTIHSSYSKSDFDNYTWAHYCYYLYKGEIAERYSSINYDEKIEDEIERKRGHRANMIRIDKLDNNLYVVTYRRSRGSYKNFHLREVDGYPFFNLPNDKGISFSDNAIQFMAKVPINHRYRDNFYKEQVVEISISDVIMLNPRYFDNPMEMKKVFIPFNFFDKNFIYNHPEIRQRAEDPMMIRIGHRGIRVYFREGATIKQF
jgi:hypothetical protein